MPYSDYRNLAPIDDAESSDEYLTVLEGALNDPRVKNIAIAGAYGSGKSSMIETFLKSGCITGKYLKVSMASFAMDTGRNDGKLSADEVEQGILKQLFYQVSPNKIPQSRYRKLQSIDPYHLFLRWTFLGGVIIFLSSIVFPNIFEPNIKYIMSLGNTVGVSSFVSIILVVEIFLLIIKWLAYTYGDTLTHIKIKMLNIFSDVKVEYGASEQSVFNKNLDEIVYTPKRAVKPRHFCTFCAPVLRFAYTLPTSPPGGRIEKAAIGAGRVYGGISQRGRADGERIIHRRRCGQRWRRSLSAYPRYHGYRDSALWLRLRALGVLLRPQV